MKKNVVLVVIGMSIWACQTTTKKEQTPVAIPPTELIAVDSGLTWRQDVLFFKHNPYSGFVIEKYPDGTLATRMGYLNGKLEGKQEKWFPNKALMEVRWYKDNRKVGRHEGWFENGQKRFEYLIQNDIPVGLQQEWYTNGQLYTRFHFDSTGQPIGSQQMWYMSGQMKSNYIIKNGRRFGFLGAKGCMGEGEKKKTGLSFKK